MSLKNLCLPCYFGQLVVVFCNWQGSVLIYTMLNYIDELKRVKQLPALVILP